VEVVAHGAVREDFDTEQPRVGMEDAGEEFLFLVAEGEFAARDAGDDVKDAGLRAGERKEARAGHKALRVSEREEGR